MYRIIQNSLTFLISYIKKQLFVFVHIYIYIYIHMYLRIYPHYMDAWVHRHDVHECKEVWNIPRIPNISAC
jgi:hypothetical protein